MDSRQSSVCPNNEIGAPSACDITTPTIAIESGANHAEILHQLDIYRGSPSSSANRACDRVGSVRRLKQVNHLETSEESGEIEMYLVPTGLGVECGLHYDIGVKVGYVDIVCGDGIAGVAAVGIELPQVAASRVPCGHSWRQNHRTGKRLLWIFD